MSTTKFDTMTTTTTITAIMSNQSKSSEGSSIGRFKKRDLAKSAVKINSAFMKSMFASKETRAEGAPGAARDVLYSSFRAALGGTFDILQGAQLSPSTTNMYKMMCKKHNKKRNSVPLGDGAKGHWIGDPNATWVMLYFPGGAFIMPGTYAHFEFMFHARKRAKKGLHDFAIFALEYSLMPQAIYPTQLRQAVLGLRYLLEVQHRSPSTILLGGDSAGGNLVAAILLHLARPHPDIPSLKLSSPIHAAMLLSPWVSMGTDTPSMYLNAKKDLLTAPAIGKAGKAYLGGLPYGDSYAEPVHATPDMWTDVARDIVGDVLITGGVNELLCDEIVIFASRLKGGFEQADPMDSEGAKSESLKNRVEIEICEGEGHDEVIIDYMSINKGKGKSAKAVKSWMAQVMK